MLVYEIMWTKPNLRCGSCYIEATSREDAKRLFYEEHDNDCTIISLDEVYDYDEEL